MDKIQNAKDALEENHAKWLDFLNNTVKESPKLMEFLKEKEKILNEENFNSVENKDADLLPPIIKMVFSRTLFDICQNK